MKKEGYYSSGQFARMSHVTLRTIRYYDQKNILKPSYVDASGARYYTDSDFARLQQILLLKYLGFSLDEIREMTIQDEDCQFMLSSLNLQKKLVQDRIEQLQNVERAITSTTRAIEENHQIDWNQMLNLIHLTEFEESFKSQYKNANNISARIRLHRDYSVNPEGWFPWVFRQLNLPDLLSAAKTDAPETSLTSSPSILELGCGDGSFWLENVSRIPAGTHITLTDISEGMIRDARRNITQNPSVQHAIRQRHICFDYAATDAQKPPYCDSTGNPLPSSHYHSIIANHLLFYMHDMEGVFLEILRLLKKGGIFLCTTYSAQHMHEIRDLVRKFDDRIVLSAENLYENFGLENGASLLKTAFSHVECRHYDDCIELNDPEPLIEYILSCHGNQNQYLLERYKDFRAFVEREVAGGFHITKDSGVFLCR